MEAELEEAELEELGAVAGAWSDCPLDELELLRVVEVVFVFLEADGVMW